MLTRFDLENDIQRAWNTVEDLNLFIQSEHKLLGDSNALQGVAHLMELRMKKLWDTMEQLIKTGNLL